MTPKTKTISKQPYLAGLVLLVILLCIPQKVSGAAAEACESQQAEQLTQEMRALSREGKFDEAIPIGIRALAICEKLQGSEDPRVGTALIELSELYRARGDYAAAKALYERAIGILEKALDAERPNAAAVIEDLNFVKRQEERGNSVKEFFADRLYDRPLPVPVQVQRNYPDVLVMLVDIAPSYADSALATRSHLLMQRALTIVETQFSPEEFAITLNDLAEFYLTKGDYAGARPLSERALGIVEAVFGPQHEVFAAALNNLAVISDVDGDYGRAVKLYKGALAIVEEDGGPYNTSLVIMLSNAAIAAWKNRDLPDAIELLRRVVDARERQTQTFFELGFHEEEATVLAESLARETNVVMSLASEAGAPATSIAFSAVTRNKGRVLDEVVRRVSGRTSVEDSTLIDKPVSFTVSSPGKAEYPGPAAQARLETTDRETRQARGREMRDVIHRLLSLQIQIQDLRQSERCRTGHECEGELARLQKELQEVNEMNDQLWSRGDPRRLERFRESRHFQEMRDRLSEMRRQGLDRTDGYLALAAEFERLGQKLRQDSRLQMEELIRGLSSELRDVNSQLSNLEVRGQVNTDGYRTLEQRRRNLEEEISYLREGTSEPETPSEARPQPLKPDLAAQEVQRLQQLIPSGAALVEFVLHEPFIPQLGRAGSQKARWGSPRYMAYVLKREGEPVAVDLGEAQSIDTAVSDLLASLRNRGTIVTKQARTLDGLLIDPLRSLLGDAGHVLISPDGKLNLLPFGVLRDEQGRYLLEQKKLTYLTGGRDLLRLVSSSPSRQPPIVLADPDFGSLEGAPPGSTFKRLPGTAAEAQELRTMLRLTDEQMFTQGRATEAALKELRGPRILHLATHGFADRFWDLSEMPPLGQDSLSKPRLGNALVRSGLALAGANQRRSGDDDGILTALEVAALDLSGTELAVLSACETGLGQVQNAEGVYGLRRALLLAGVRTQVTSLWKVDDSATKDMMIDYYARLRAGTGRSQALREAQLAMLKDPGHAHPYYWAAFIAIGEDKPISGW
jgi:CHAT domain-containing protein